MVERYYCDDELTITEQPNGEYVLFDDYATLESDYARLREALRECVAWLKGISTFKMTEICCDEFAYDRMVKTFQKAALSALEESHAREVLGDDKKEA